MIAWLLKTMLCAGALLAIYKILLEKEKMHLFNRFYLLCSVVFSFVVPLITFRTNTLSTPVAAAILNTTDIFPLTGGGGLQQQLVINNSHTPWPALLLPVYIVVTTVLLYRFIKNLLGFYTVIKSNTIARYQGALLVLMGDKMSPHSFFKYIFINKEDFEKDAIEKEIMQHELTHVRQKHSIDVLLIELLRVFAWFNPFLHLYKTAIRLNHEFLADDEVNNTFCDIPAYQILLLSKINPVGNRSLTSSFNYHITKKRFIMMTKNTPRAVVVLKQIALLPLLITVVILFSAKTQAQEPPKVSKTVQKQIESAKDDAPADVMEAYRSILSGYKLDTKEGRRQFRKNVSPEEKAKLEELFKKMSRQQQEGQIVGFMPPADPLPRITPAHEALDSYKNAEKYGVWVDEKKVANSMLNNYKATDFAQVFISRLYGGAKKNVSYEYQVDLMTREYYRKYYEEAIARANINIMYVKRPRPQ